VGVVQRSERNRHHGVVAAEVVEQDHPFVAAVQFTVRTKVRSEDARRREPDHVGVPVAQNVRRDLDDLGSGERRDHRLGLVEALDQRHVTGGLEASPANCAVPTRTEVVVRTNGGVAKSSPSLTTTARCVIGCAPAGGDTETSAPAIAPIR
jgi:hypothetical protein